MVQKLTLVNTITNNEQYIRYSNTLVNLYINSTTFNFNNVLVNVEININYNY